jgi:hypothetical protein
MHLHHLGGDMSDVTKKEYRRSPTSRVKWADFEPLLSQLRQSLGHPNNREVLQYIGYNGASNLSTWQKEDSVPAVAQNAAIGVLAQLKAELPAPPVRQQFTQDELAAIMVAMIKSPWPDKALVSKIAAELAKSK